MSDGKGALRAATQAEHWGRREGNIPVVCGCVVASTRSHLCAPHCLFRGSFHDHTHLMGKMKLRGVMVRAVFDLVLELNFLKT